MNLKLAEHARTFHGLTQQVMGQQQQQRGLGNTQQQQQQQRQGWAGQHVQKPGQQQPQQPHGSLGHLQSLCSRSSIQYHPACTLTVYQRSSSSSKFFGRGSSKAAAKGGRGRRGRGGKGAAAQDECSDGEDEEEELEEQPAVVKQTSMFLKLPAAKLDRRKFRCVGGDATLLLAARSIVCFYLRSLSGLLPVHPSQHPHSVPHCIAVPGV